MLIRRRSNTELPPTIAEVERVTTMKILGVTIREDLGTSTHTDGILEVCSRSLYALRVLKSHGLPTTALHDVARATTVSRLLYAAPAWWGFTKAEDRNRLDRFLQRSRRMGYLPDNAPDVSDMVRRAEDRLLTAVSRNTSHVLRSLFPPVIKRSYSLRPRTHDFVLPPKDDKNYIPRVLYRRLLNR